MILCNVRREMWAVAYSKTPALETCSDSVSILSLLMLSSCGAKGSVMTAKQTS